MILANRVAAGYRTDNFTDPKVALSARDKMSARFAKLTEVTPRRIMPAKQELPEEHPCVKSSQDRIQPATAPSTAR